MPAYFDAHCDTLTTGSVYHHLQLAREPWAHRGQIFAVCADGQLQRDLTFFDAALANLPTQPAILCTSAAELQAAATQQKTAAIIGIEGAECVGCDAALLRAAYQKGARVLGLTHNAYFGLAGTCREHAATALTDAGRRFCSCAAELGMILDFSHLSDPAAKELLQTYPGAVMASHSNARTVCGNLRNLTDALFVQLCARRGVCGLNLYAEFLSDTASADFDSIRRHLEHFLTLTPSAAQCLCLGCDLDGCDRLPQEIRTSPDLSALYAYLLRKNYPQSFVDGIFWKNLYRFLLRALP